MTRFFGGLAVLAWLLGGIGNHAVAQSLYIGPGGIGFGYSSDHDRHHDGHHGHYQHRGHHGYDHHGDHHGRSSFGLRLGPDYGHGHDRDYYSSDFYYPRAYYYPRREVTEVVESRPVPSPAQLARMSREDLHHLLRLATERLGDELADLKTGEGWARHLRLQALSALADAEHEAGAVAPDRAQLAEIAAAFDSTAKERKYNAIARLWGFRTVHGTLTELSMHPSTRQRRQLAETTAWLGRSLVQLKTGERWKSYLQLASLEEMLADAAEGDVASDAAMRDALPAMLVKFDKVGDAVAYKMIADLPAFQATHEVLTAYCGSIAAPSPPVELPMPREERHVRATQ